MITILTISIVYDIFNEFICKEISVSGGNTRAYGENSSGDKDGKMMARSGDGGGGGGGGGGVGYGRTMKEYEDELSSLKKENFQLKLRIYFLEEKNPARSGISSSDEDVIKTNVELKVDISSILII